MSREELIGALSLLTFAFLFVGYAFVRGVQDIRKGATRTNWVWFRRFSSTIGAALGFVFGAAAGFGIGKLIDTQIGDLYFSAATLTVPLFGIVFAIVGIIGIPRLVLGITKQSEQA